MRGMLALLVCKHSIRWVLLIGLVGLVGCQATPGMPAVIDRMEMTLEHIQSYESERTTLTLPARWEDEIKTEHVAFHITADIRVSKQEYFPVYRVKRGAFEPEDINQIAQAMLTTPVTAKRDTATTREDVEMMLAYAIRGMPKKQSDGTLAYEPYDGQQEYIDQLQQMLEAGNLPPVEYEAANAVDMASFPDQAHYMLEDGSMAAIYGDEQSISIMTGTFLVVQTESMLEEGGGFEGEGNVVLNPSILEEQARAMAVAFLEEIGTPDGMQIASAEAARLLHLYSYDTYSEGWLIVFNHTMEYLAYEYRLFGSNTGGGGLRLSADEALYSAPWPQEWMGVYVDHNGIQMIYWNNPIEVIEQVVHNVSLADIDAIFTNVKNLVRYGISWHQGGHEEIYLYDVVLTTALTAEKDNPSIAIMYPVWVFSHRYKYGYDTNTGTPGGFAINAMDGSRVNLFPEN